LHDRRRKGEGYYSEIKDGDTGEFIEAVDMYAELLDTDLEGKKVVEHHE